MKRLSEHSREELANLTDEQYDMLVDLECMHEGAPLSIEKPRYKEVPTVPGPNVEVYEVCGFILTDKAEADKLVETINGLQSYVELDYSYRVSSDYRYISEKKIKPAKEIRTRDVYTKDAYTEIQSTLEDIKTIKEYNDELREDYEERCEKRYNVIHDISEAIRTAIDELEELRAATEVYKKYLDLSNGNEEVAQNFFKTGRYAELLPEIIENLKSKEE
jgi:hypothetical protein